MKVIMFSFRKSRFREAINLILEVAVSVAAIMYIIEFIIECLTFRLGFIEGVFNLVR